MVLSQKAKLFGMDDKRAIQASKLMKVPFTTADLRHSEKESRFLRLGRAATGRVLIVAYAVGKRDDGESIRIISSARRASRKERTAYAAAEKD